MQGTPTEFNDRVWKYGLTAVYFNNGRVTSWDISPLNPIRPDGKRGAELVAALVEVVAEQRGGQRCVDEAGGDEVHPDGRHFERQVGDQGGQRGGARRNERQAGAPSPAAGAAHEQQRAAGPHPADGMLGDGNGQHTNARRNRGAPARARLARWENAQYSYNLFRASYGMSFGLVAFSKRLESMASAASREADRLDRLEAPARETERQKKQDEDAQASQEKARLISKPRFRP